MNHDIGIRHGKAGVVFFFLLLLAFSVFANGAEASPGYLSSFSTAYPSSPLTRDCLICHTTSNASPSTRNPYGSAYGSAGHNFATIELLDSDGDGASNIAEINAGTYPGNASSVPAAALSITTASPLPAGTVGTAYNQSFASSGGSGTKTWSVSAGTLPAGLSLSSAGVLSGTPTTAATSSFTVQVTGGGTATKAFSLTINDVTPPAGALDVMPQDTATDVPVNTVITTTESGLTDISAIFNGDTFTLRPDVSTPDSAMDPSWPYRSAVCTSAGVVQGTFTYNAARTEATFTPNCPLENGTTYLASIAAGSGSTLTAPENWTFTTIASSPDSDEDGSPDNEDDSPHDGQRTSRWSAKGTGKIHVDSSRTAGTFLRGAVGISDTSSSLNQAGKPAGYAFHDGMIAFREVGVVSGSSAQVTVTFPSPILQGSKVYRAGADGFHEVPSAVIDGNTVTLTVTGGSPSIHAAANPSDNVAQDNGVLVDPVGVAAPVSSGSGSIDMSSSASGGGCSVVGGSGPAGSNIDAFLILASLGVTVRMFRIRRLRG